MTVNIKDNCSPWELDPGKFYLMGPKALSIVASGASGIWYKDFTFGRKVHITKVGVVLDSSLVSLATTGFVIGAYKATTTASGVLCSVEAADATGGAMGTVIWGDETEMEFLTTDELKLCIKTARNKNGMVNAIVEYEIA